MENLSKKNIEDVKKLCSSPEIATKLLEYLKVKYSQRKEKRRSSYVIILTKSTKLVLLLLSTLYALLLLHDAKVPPGLVTLIEPIDTTYLVSWVSVSFWMVLIFSFLTSIVLWIYGAYAKASNTTSLLLISLAASKRNTLQRIFSILVFLLLSFAFIVSGSWYWLLFIFYTIIKLSSMVIKVIIKAYLGSSIIYIDQHFETSMKMFTEEGRREIFTENLSELFKNNTTKRNTSQ